MLRKRGSLTGPAPRCVGGSGLRGTRDWIAISAGIIYAVAERADLGRDDNTGEPKGNANLTWVDSATVPPKDADSGLQTSDTEDLLFGEVIGRGGTALVMAAHQRSLSRSVAVKESHQGQDSASLVQEALVVARLQHPSIVPVHALDTDEKGRPRIIMSRVHGVMWSAIIEQPHQHVGLMGSEDPLMFHLRVLVDVCQAVAYAHSEGVMHRDIKPENVMIGRFGQVYLLDWGSALALREHPNRVLRLVHEPHRSEGTPAYMAPEMVKGGMLSERTDVFLLGATLHYVLTGRGRNVAEGTGPSRWMGGTEIPAELNEICDRACAASPEQRFSSVLEVVDAIRSYQSHRASADLSADALSGLPALVAALDEDRVDPEKSAESRYALMHSLRLWPGNEPAKAGLQQLLAASVAYHLRAGDPGSAEALLPNLDARPELIEWVREVRADQRGMRAELAGMKHDMDPSVAARIRIRSLFDAGLVMMVAGVVAQSVWMWGWLGPYPTTLAAAAMASAMLFPIFRVRSNETHQRASLAARLRMIGSIGMVVVGWGLGIPIHAAISVSLVLMAMMLGSAWLTLPGVVVNASSVAVYLTGALAAGALPPWTLVIWGFTVGVASWFQAWANYQVLQQHRMAS